MAELVLPPEYLTRLEDYYDQLCRGTFPEAKSDYWADHSAHAKITFHTNRVVISGQSGFYIPPRRTDSTRYRLRTWVQRKYKSLVFRCDRALGLSMPHAFGSYMTYDMAYDHVMNGPARIEYAGFDEYQENPHRFAPSELEPLFADSGTLGREWFLAGDYVPSGSVYLAAYYYSLFTHFLAGSVERYLEIGAGNGNLASFFAHDGRARITIINLPEVVLFSSCYLKSIFPNATVLLPHEVPSTLTEQDLDSTDLLFLVPSQSSTLPRRAFDMVTNTSSMQEMTTEQIGAYFELVQDVAKDGGLWCNVNRAEKFVSRTEKPVRAFEFPYRPGNQVLMSQVDPFLRLVQPDNVVTHIESIRNAV
ncbi:MAG: putative sugar O-methyltransferase [Gemmatimonadetes bacterium]|nr:putative sugar O-methyltransferase [Gemmatimonadota bacterium]